MQLRYVERRPIVRELHREYRAASKRRKGEILDELERLHYNRSYARRLMRQGHRRVRRVCACSRHEMSIAVSGK
jgi:hypothetical protein